MKKITTDNTFIRNYLGNRGNIKSYNNQKLSFKILGPYFNL